MKETWELEKLYQPNSNSDFLDIQTLIKSNQTPKKETERERETSESTNQLDEVVDLVCFIVKDEY